MVAAALPAPTTTVRPAGGSGRCGGRHWAGLALASAASSRRRRTILRVFAHAPPCQSRGQASSGERTRRIWAASAVRRDALPCRRTTPGAGAVRVTREPAHDPCPPPPALWRRPRDRLGSLLQHGRLLRPLGVGRSVGDHRGPLLLRRARRAADPLRDRAGAGVAGAARLGLAGDRWWASPPPGGSSPTCSRCNTRWWPT